MKEAVVVVLTSNSWTAQRRSKWPAAAAGVASERPGGAGRQRQQHLPVGLS